MDLELALRRLARRQHGLVTLAQALSLGMTVAQVRHHLSTGRWVAVRKGVYAGGWVRPSFEQAALAAVLAGGEGCWASHATAARLWGLLVPTVPTLEVLTLVGRRLRLDGVRHHRSADLPLNDVASFASVPCTSAARTLVDCVPLLPGDSLSKAVTDAERRHLVTAPSLAECLGRLDVGHGGRKLVPLRKVIADRLAGPHPGANDAEMDWAGVLLDGGLPRPEQQLEVSIDGARYFLDYGWRPLLVGLEFDGFAEHGLLRQTFDEDRVRLNALQASGWLILHATTNSRPGEVVARVGQALVRRGWQAAA